MADPADPLVPRVPSSIDARGKLHYGACVFSSWKVEIWEDKDFPEDETLFLSLELLAGERPILEEEEIRRLHHGMGEALRYLDARRARDVAERARIAKLVEDHRRDPEEMARDHLLKTRGLYYYGHGSNDRRNPRHRGDR